MTDNQAGPERTLDRGLDPITADVIRWGLVTTAEEMKLQLMRSAYNAIIYEVLDFSCGVFDRRGRLAAQASGLAVFLGTLDWAVQAVIEKHDGDIRPGDVFITNDPYSGGGTHLNDVCVVQPVHSRDSLIGFSASRAHWTDIGGAVPLSVQPNAKNLHAEGLILPVIRLIESGTPVASVFDLLRANIRDPDRQLGDLRAQLAAATAGSRRLRELSQRYGSTVLTNAIEHMQNATETFVRNQIRQMPNMTTTAEDFLDDDGAGGPPVAIRVKLEIHDEDIILDFTGTDPASPSGCNATLCALVSACRVIFKAIIDPASPANDGSFRALKIHAPTGTVVNADYPTAVSLYGEPGRRAIDCVWRALGEILPTALPAAHYGTMAGVAMAGFDDRSGANHWVTFQGPTPGGWGASYGTDGESALICVTNGDTRLTPAEIVEHAAPLRVLGTRLREGSGGDGQWRGGLGIENEYEVLTHASFAITCAFGRTDFQPFGINGGGDAESSIVELWRNGQLTARLARDTAVPLEYGDRIIVKTGGGGGFGPAEARSPELRALDEVRGYTRRATETV